MTNQKVSQKDVWESLDCEKIQITDAEARLGYLQSTFETENSVLAVLQPESEEVIEQIVNLANKNSIALYPLSNGYNWGYGSRVPSANLSTIVDLSKMKKITGYDDQLGLVSVQPGVSTEDLNHFLSEHGGAFFYGGPATTGMASVLGNALERGIGVGRSSFRQDQVISLDLILGDGTRINTGITSQTQKRAHFKYPTGLDITDLFFQTNFSIVLEGRIKLEPMPNRFATLYTEFETIALKDFMHEIRWLYRQGTLEANSTIGNSTRSQSLNTGHEVNSNKFVFSTAIYAGDKLQLYGKMLAIRNRLKGLSSLFHLNHNDLRILSEFFPFIFSKRRKQGLQHLSSSKYIGGQSRAIASLVQSQARTKNFERLKDHLGLRWYSSCLPFEPGLLCQVIDEVSFTSAEFGFSPNVGLNFLDWRTAYLTVAVMFDLDDASDNSKAEECMRTLTEQGLQRGFVPARAPLGKSPSLSHDQLRMHRHLKSVFDPNDVISPGRYDGK